ncbi:MAG: TraB/GumN family protein, partial [Saprospiraceae bacterium]
QILSDYYRPKKYQKMRKMILKSYDLDIDHFDTKTPFFFSNMLSEASLPGQNVLALDHLLWQFALAEGKEMKGVESFDDQVEILKKIPLDYQIKALKDIVSNISSFRHKLNKLNELYALGKYDQLYKSTKKSMGKIRKLMIYDRNHHMASRIIELSSEKTAFFAIGAGHLAGGNGLLALLKKKGYKLKVIEI